MFRRIIDDNSEPQPGESHLAALTAGERYVILSTYFNNYIYNFL